MTKIIVCSELFGGCGRGNWNLGFEFLPSSIECPKCKSDKAVRIVNFENLRTVIPMEKLEEVRRAIHVSETFQHKYLNDPDGKPWLKSTARPRGLVRENQSGDQFPNSSAKDTYSACHFGNPHFAVDWNWIELERS
jgi:hypothetical protein